MAASRSIKDELLWLDCHVEFMMWLKNDSLKILIIATFEQVSDRISAYPAYKTHIDGAMKSS